jgi:hypothetical protein
VTSTGRDDNPRWYEIRVQGHLEPRWSAWFDGLTLTPERDGTTVIHGPIIDQAALHGLLQKLRDTGLPLVSVTRVDTERPGPATGPSTEPTTGPR